MGKVADDGMMGPGTVTADPGRDVVLITIDCFRYDALAAMRHFKSLVGNRTTLTWAIAPSYKTPLVSPSLLQSRLFPDVLSDTRAPDRTASTRYSVDGSIPSLPRVLSTDGYATAAFIGGNPYLRQYADHFDVYWDGLAESGPDGRIGSARTWLSRVNRLLLLRKRVPGDRVVRNAREWYTATDGPRFLWLHFMEPHFPYFPGIARGRNVGLRDAYRATVTRFRSDGSADIPDRDVATLRRLYWEAVRRVDTYLPRVFSFVDDDAVIALTGDHGEAFDHRPIGHNDLYDETIRVPLVLFNLPDLATDSPTAEQMDIAPTVVDAVGAPLPGRWEGVPMGEGRSLEALLVSAKPKSGPPECGVGLRTEDEKLIRWYDFRESAYAGSEFYDLVVDPGETENRYDRRDPPRLEERLDELLERRDLLSKLDRFDRGEARDGPPQVAGRADHRLEELGYR